MSRLTVRREETDMPAGSPSIALNTDLTIEVDIPRQDLSWQAATAFAVTMLLTAQWSARCNEEHPVSRAEFDAHCADLAQRIQRSLIAAMRLS